MFLFVIKRPLLSTSDLNCSHFFEFLSVDFFVWRTLSKTSLDPDATHYILSKGNLKAKPMISSLGSCQNVQFCIGSYPALNFKEWIMNFSSSATPSKAHFKRLKWVWAIFWAYVIYGQGYYRYFANFCFVSQSSSNF